MQNQVTAPDLTDQDPTDPELAARLVLDASTLAAQMRRGGLTTQAKTSVSDVVTAADLAAEKLVTEALTALRPDDGIVGEEGTAVAGSTGRTWVIDPVDGTYNFASGLDYWCSALALRGPDESAATGEDTVILGAVAHEPSGESWLGGPDHPTALRGVPVPHLLDRPLEQISLSTYLHPTLLHDPHAREPFLAMASRAATVRMLGSGSMDLAGVASGRLGVWAQHSTPSWDWLPGAALVRGAGGVARTVEHRGLRWHVAGNGQVVKQVIELLTGA